MNSKELLLWCESNNIKNRSIDCFWEYYNNYTHAKEDSINSVLATINIQYLSLTSWKMAFSVLYIDDKFNQRNQITYVLHMYYFGKYIGSFSVYYNDKAEIVDELLDIDSVKWLKKFCLQIKKNNYTLIED